MNDFPQDFEPDFSDDSGFSIKSTDAVFSDIPKKKRNSLINLSFEFLEMLAIAVVFVMIFLTVFARHSPVEGKSMQPTLYESDVLVISGFFYTPRRGDVVVIHVPADFQTPYVKRVIAIGGDVLEIDFNEWTIHVNGNLVEEDYINPFPQQVGHPMTSGDLPMINGVFRGLVPNGHIFVLGDNRNHSLDSRNSSVGFIDNRYVVGRALFRMWPPSRWGGV
ncbi:MAG: signal peptidase I [Oscillospiraceae bacterium]|nr:signal peptidase I [Oscillospiraceae bacterium]